MTATAEKTAGRVVRITGPVVDIEFPRGAVPELFNALHADITYGALAKTLTLEVAQHLGDNLVRCISMQPTDGPVDILVNNAGIDRVGLFPDASASDVQNLLQVNLAAPLELCRQAMPRMVRRGRGHIVNVSSYGAIAQGPGVTLYGTSKAGLSHFTAGIRAELRGKPVGTTLVQLGEVRTDMIDHIREFTPARKTIERFERLRMLPSSALEPEVVATAIADAIERNKRHVVMPRQIVAMAKVTEFPRRMSEILLTGIDQNEK